MRTAWSSLIPDVLLAFTHAGCADDIEQPATETASDTETGSETGSETGTGTATSDTGTSTSSESGTDTDATTDPGTTTAADPCQDGTGDCPVVVVMGYWPPTNEMLRQWSQNPEQNPGEWTGKNWNGLGYDIYAFFPEFPPDGNPSNDPIGSPGSVGSPESDLQVDYQDTSADFWRIVDEYQPVILLTTSRGGDIGWEVEAVEGGHEHPMNPGGEPHTDWIPDGYGDEYLPTEDTVEERSWDCISTYREGNQLATMLPADEIVEAVSELNLASVQIEYGTSGRYLSGFLGLHGLCYNEQTPSNLVAGHIHVGKDVPNADATAMVETTMTVILELQG